MQAVKCYKQSEDTLWGRDILIPIREGSGEQCLSRKCL